ncbi:hypothetical protein ACFXTH_022803 [Malus domestica]
MAKEVASQSVFCISSGLDEIAVGSKSPKGEFRVSPSFSTSQFKDANSRAFPSLSLDFLGKPMTLSDNKGLENCRVRKPSNFSVHAQSSVCAWSNPKVKGKSLILFNSTKQTLERYTRLAFALAQLGVSYGDVVMLLFLITFIRRFRLPENAKIDQVKAAMENEVLTVTVCKEEKRRKTSLCPCHLQSVK